METSSPFHEWERYPYRRYNPPYSWSLNVTSGQSRHLATNKAKYSHESFCVDVVTLDRGSARSDEINTQSNVPKIEMFTSETAFLAHIQTINRDLQCTLIFVRSDLPVSSYDLVEPDAAPFQGHEEQEEDDEDIKGEPCITYSAVFKLCTLFDIQQSFMVSLLQDPHFSCHWASSINDQDRTTRDVSYCIPMPWYQHFTGRIAVTPIPQYSVRVYSKYRENGQPMFSLFFNVQKSLIKEIAMAWRLCVLEAETSPGLRFLDHWALQNNSIARVQEKCRFHEALYDLVFSNSVASHLGVMTADGAWGTLTQTVSKGSDVLDYLQSVVLPLECVEQVIHELAKLQTEDLASRRLGNEAKSVQLKQEVCWSSSLSTTIGLIKKRNDVTLKRAEREMIHLFNIMRLRDSESMNQNTAYMARLADAQQESGADMRQFAWDSRQDARLMKFLAEVTMVFLPITAVSTTFSMGFFAIDQSSLSFLPFSSLRYIWIFLVTTAMVSLATWIVWWQRWKKLKLDDRKFRQDLDEERRAKASGQSAETSSSKEDNGQKWLDVEFLGSRISEPEWTTEGLSDAFLEVCGGDEQAVSISES